MITLMELTPYTGDAVAPSPNHNPRNALAIEGIVLHATADRGNEARALSWMRTPRSRVSCHLHVGRSGRVTRLVGDRQRAWHAGASWWRGTRDVNSITLGIEIANRNDGEPYTEAQYARVVEIVVHYCRQGLSLDAVIGHHDIAPGRKTDPHGWDWDYFRATVQFYLEAETVSAPIAESMTSSAEPVALPVHATDATTPVPSASSSAARAAPVVHATDAAPVAPGMLSSPAPAALAVHAPEATPSASVPAAIAVHASDARPSAAVPAARAVHAPDARPSAVVPAARAVHAPDARPSAPARTPARAEPPRPRPSSRTPSRPPVVSAAPVQRARPEAAPKPLLRSRTLWLNGLTVLAVAVAIAGQTLELAFWVGLPLPERVTMWVLFAVGVLNIVLRFFTTRPIGSSDTCPPVAS